MLYETWLLITYLGDPRLWIGLSVIFFLIRMFYRYKKKDNFKWATYFVIFVGVSMGLAFLLSTGMKYYFQIPRECIPCPADFCNQLCDESFSFPSGHATAAFAAFTGLFLILKKKKHVWLLIFPILVSLSRVALGVHTYLDIFVGSLVGLLFSFGFYYLVKRFFPVKKERRTLEKFINSQESDA